jgi:hypothetical protein
MCTKKEMLRVQEEVGGCNDLDKEFEWHLFDIDLVFL